MDFVLSEVGPQSAGSPRRQVRAARRAVFWPADKDVSGARRFSIAGHGVGITSEPIGVDEDLKVYDDPRFFHVLAEGLHASHIEPCIRDNLVHLLYIK